MGKRFLIDTNIVIDYLGKKPLSHADIFLNDLLPIVSIVTRMEVLGWYGATKEQLAVLRPFFQYATIYPIEESIVFQTILIWQHHKIKLPDAIIAATAMVHGLDLITRNVKDFKNLANLKTLDV